MEIEGRIHVIKNTESFGDNFRKRDVVITIEGKYPQTVIFQVVNDECDTMNDYKVGDDVKVQFNLRGREWTNPATGEIKFFNTLQIWSIILTDTVGKIKNNNTFESQNEENSNFDFLKSE